MHPHRRVHTLRRLTDTLKTGYNARAFGRPHPIPSLLVSSLLHFLTPRPRSVGTLQCDRLSSTTKRGDVEKMLNAAARRLPTVSTSSHAEGALALPLLPPALIMMVSPLTAWYGTQLAQPVRRDLQSP